MDKQWGSVLLRLLLGFTFLYVGLGKLFLGMRPVEPVAGILNALGMSFIPALTFVYILGILELVVGLMFVFGLFTKAAGWIATVMLLLFVIGVGAILGDGLGGQMMMFKDIGLIGGALCLAFQGSSYLSLDSKIWRN